MTIYNRTGGEMTPREVEAWALEMQGKLRDLHAQYGEKDRTLIATIAGSVAAGLVQRWSSETQDRHGAPCDYEFSARHDLDEVAGAAVGIATAIVAEVDRRAGESK